MYAHIHTVADPATRVLTGREGAHYVAYPDIRRLGGNLICFPVWQYLTFISSLEGSQNQ